MRADIREHMNDFKASMKKLLKAKSKSKSRSRSRHTSSNIGEH